MSEAMKDRALTVLLLACWLTLTFGMFLVAYSTQIGHYKRAVTKQKEAQEVRRLVRLAARGEAHHIREGKR